MELSKDYFALQLRFVQRVAQICQIDFEDALLDYTNFYLQFIGSRFDPTHPVWQEYLAGLRQAQDPAAWSHSFYQTHKDEPTSSSSCFSYSYWADVKTVRIHFLNKDLSGYGPLNDERLPIRIQELRELFADVRRQHPDAETARGGSWLYNLDKYKRIFPAEYVATAEIAEGEFQFIALWGQFLRRDGELREPTVSTFEACVQQQDSLEGIARCFPYQVLRPECPITHFYRFYGIEVE